MHTNLIVRIVLVNYTQKKKITLMKLFYSKYKETLHTW